MTRLPAVRPEGTFELVSTMNVRSVPSSPRMTSQLPLDDTTVPVIVDSEPLCEVLDEDWPCCVPVVEPDWAASSPATPRLRAAPNKNA